MAGDPFAQDAWTRARDRFMEDLTEQERAIYHQSSLEMIFYDASAAQKRHENASTSRGFLTKLEPLTSAIEQYGEALDVYVSAYPLVLSPLWGSLRIVLLLASEFRKYFEKLVDMLERIGDVLPRFRVYESLFPNNERLLHSLSLVYVEILKFCYDAKAVFRRSKHPLVVNLRTSLKLTWKPFDMQFGDHLRQFREHKKSVEKEAELSHMVESADSRALVKANQIQLQQEKQENDRKRMLSQLSAVSHVDLHQMQRQAYFPGTGLWALKTSEYIKWKSFNGPRGLYCYGIPGCGKSVLASTIVEDLISTERQSGALLLYFYCSFADSRSLVKSQILGNLLRQLVHKGAVSEEVQSELVSSFGTDGRNPGDEKLIQEIRNAAGRSDRLYIVLDGLDECNEETLRGIMDFLIDLVKNTSLEVRVLLTCREESHIEESIHDWSRIKLDEQASADDIQAFVASSVRHRIEKGEMKISNPLLEIEVITTLANKAHGMFLWIHFQLIDLCGAMSSAQIRDTLQNLPDGLGDTYERILKSISRVSNKARVAERVFMWLACARRPLRVGELQEAVAIDDADKVWDSEKIPDPDLLLQSCQGLVIRDPNDSTVRFAHYTVQQYLDTRPIAEPHLWRDAAVPLHYNYKMQNAEAYIAQTCITYLSFSDFETAVALRPSDIHFDPSGILGPGGAGTVAGTLGIGKPVMSAIYKVLGGRSRSTSLNINVAQYLNIKSKPTTPAMTTKHVLLDYIIQNWPWHVDAAQEIDLDLLRRNGPLATLVFNKILPFEFRPWGPNRHFGPRGCSSCWTDPNMNPRNLTMTSMMHWAAEQGLVSLLGLLENIHGRDSETNIDLNPSRLEDYLFHEKYSDESMLIACRNGQTNVVQYLAGYQSVAGYPYQEKAMSCSKLCMAACASGHEETLETLFDLGRVCSREEIERSLFVAATKGYGSIVRVLVRRGSSAIQENKGVEQEDDEAPSPRQFFEAFDEYSGLTPLHTAANNGHVDIVDYLGGLYTDIDIMDVASDSTALACAIRHGHTHVVQSLLLHQASVKARGKNTQSPLSLAAEYGYTSVVRCLLDGGASVDEMQEPFKHGTGRGTSPRMCAASEEHTEVVDVLLDFAQKIRFEDGLGWRAVHCAASEGRLETLRKLLERGAENSRSFRGWNGIHHAAQNGHDSCVEFLASLGTSLDALSNESFWAQTALHVATANNQRSTILALGRLGADLKIMDIAQNTAYDMAMDVTSAAELRQTLIEAEKAQTDRPRLWQMHHLATTAGVVSSAVYRGLNEEVESCIDDYEFNDSDTKYLSWLVRKERAVKIKQIDPRITDLLQRKLLALGSNEFLKPNPNDEYEG